MSLMTNRFEHKKSLGQHFLTSDVVPNWMADAADISPGDVVLEVGPGTGILTKTLLARGATVIALEADARAIAVLEDVCREAITTNQLTIHHTDVRTLSLTAVPGISDHTYKVVANIPYYLSGHLFRSFLQTNTQPTDLVFLVQKEVAKRATSALKRGDKHSLLSLSVQVYGTANYVKTVSRGHFTPPPKVDSGIIAVRDISRNRFNDYGIDEESFFTLLHHGFAQKRKQLLSNLVTQGKYDRETISTILNALNIPPTVRAEDVSLFDWLTLCAQLINKQSTT